MRVASKVGNRPFKFGHARPLRSGIIRYVRDGRTDRQTNGQKQRLLAHSLRSGHKNELQLEQKKVVVVHSNIIISTIIM